MRYPSAVTIYRAFSIAAFIGILFEDSWQRLIWGAFCAALFVSAEKFKDVEKIKRKERIETELRMEKGYNEAWSASLGNQYKLVTDHITSAFENALKQLSTYVRDASPTRSARLSVVNEDDDVIA